MLEQLIADRYNVTATKYHPCDWREGCVALFPPDVQERKITMSRHLWAFNHLRATSIARRY
jgi:hypothetical protein